MSIVVEIVNIDLKPTLPDLFQGGRRDGVSLFRNELKRGFDSRFVVQIHERTAEAQTLFSFHVVRHKGATGMSIGPKPDERYLIDTLDVHCLQQQRFMQQVHGAIKRPARKFVRGPLAEEETLQMPAPTYR